MRYLTMLVWMFLSLSLMASNVSEENSIPTDFQSVADIFAVGASVVEITNEQGEGLTIGETIEILEAPYVNLCPKCPKCEWGSFNPGVLGTCLWCVGAMLIIPGSLPGLALHLVCGLDLKNGGAYFSDAGCNFSMAALAPAALCAAAAVLSPLICLAINGCIYLYNSKTKTLFPFLDELEKEELLSDDHIYQLSPIILGDDRLLKKLNTVQNMALRPDARIDS